MTLHFPKDDKPMLRYESVRDMVKERAQARTSDSVRSAIEHDAYLDDLERYPIVQGELRPDTTPSTGRGHGDAVWNLIHQINTMNKLHIPTEQYGFAEIDFEGSAEEAISEYRRLTKLATGGVGMDTRDFNKVLDSLIEKQSIEGDPGMVDTMSIEQQTILQAVKRSQARIKSKLN